MIVSAQPHFHIQQHELLTPETFNPTESLKYHYSAAAQRRVLYRHPSCHVSAGHQKEPRVDMAGGVEYKLILLEVCSVMWLFSLCISMATGCKLCVSQ